MPQRVYITPFDPDEFAPDPVSGPSPDDFQKRFEQAKAAAPPPPETAPQSRVEAGFNLVQPPVMDLLPAQFSTKHEWLGTQQGVPFDPHQDIEDRRLDTPQDTRLRAGLERKARQYNIPFQHALDPETQGPLAREMQAQVPAPIPGAMEIPDRYKKQLDAYQTQLTPKEEQAYLKWGRDRGVNITPEHELDYDLRGFWKNGGVLDARQHASDEFKKPNHPTFSDESRYHGLANEFGGHWTKNPDNTWTFRAGQANMDYWGPENLKRYFAKNEPGNHLLVPGDEGYDKPVGLPKREVDALPPGKPQPNWGKPDLPIRKKK